MPVSSPLDRTAVRLAFRQEEEACLAERMRQAAPATAVHGEAAAIAGKLIGGARERKASGIDAFLQQFGLATEEGIALMCLAEALLRVPDAETVGGEERVEPAGLASARAFDQPRGERGGLDMNCRGGRGLAQPLFDAGAFLLAVNGTQRKAVDHGAPLHPVSAVINPLIPERIAVALDVARRSAPEVRREA